MKFLLVPRVLSGALLGPVKLDLYFLSKPLLVFNGIPLLAVDFILWKLFMVGILLLVSLTP